MFFDVSAYLHLLLSVLYSTVSRKWELIFHARAGNGEKVMPAFYGTHSKCAANAGVSCRIQDGCFQDAIDPSAVLLLKSEPKHHLRSSIIDHWVNANIKMVKVSLFKDGEEVAYIVFNAVGSTKDNWFHNTRILESSWCDVLTNGKYNIFSILGLVPLSYHINFL
ncbi:hypothetical protein FSP39_016496 [Pinctada imbricata]|uniref:Uncharacterized protein n=1 Tax=Pinctada imbricata TaxID=66713 RepID=A0AA88YIN6_PINIB|nr:hypothetical protein FSP39_016496 [Pinctada imbricata]